MANAAPKARRLWLAWLSGILLLVVVGSWSRAGAKNSGSRIS